MRGELSYVFGYEFECEGDAQENTSTLFTCSTCGALTFAEAIHAAWHDQLDHILKGIA